MLEVIKQVRPAWVVGENVAGIGSMELENSLSAVESHPDTPEDGESINTSVLDGVCNDLEGIGYEVQPFVIPACAVNAPHRRDRIWIIANSGYEGLQGTEWRGTHGERDWAQTFRPTAKQIKIPTWDRWPTQPPVRGKYDGILSTMVRNIKSEVYATECKNYRNEDLQEVWNAFQSEEIREQIGRLYKIHTEGILFQVLQLFETPHIAQGEFSPFGEKASEGLLRTLSKYGSFGCSPQGRELEKQFREQFTDTLPLLSHEVALAAKKIEKECASFNSWHRNESIKAYGNAVVPQVVYEVFRAIQAYEDNLS